jgi:hypothetical protein
MRRLGQSDRFSLTPGQAHDLEGANALLPDLLESIQALLADKAYDAQERVLDLLQARVEADVASAFSICSKRQAFRASFRQRKTGKSNVPMMKKCTTPDS